jgi:nucleoside-diphosphate-sugar epimerase
MHSVMITGGAGNLGSKLVQALAQAPWCDRVVAVDRQQALSSRTSPGLPKVVPTALDLTELRGDVLADVVAQVDTIVHFAVVDAMPDAGWEDSAASVEMTSRLLLAARDAGLRRFVFASSNHAVGALKDGPLLPAGSLRTDRVAPGTTSREPGGVSVGYAYGASKAFTERLCVAAARPGGLTTVSVRVGWCQPGENRPQTLNAGGSPDAPRDAPTTPDGERDLRWFRNMWLSNRDFLALFERAVLAPAEGWPEPGIVVNGMSANQGMPWDIETTRRLIGYEPRDDVWSEL